jgi:hypothetical protein
MDQIEIEKAAEQMEAAQRWVADTANLLIASWKDGGRQTSRDGVVVDSGDFEELREAVEKWSAASGAFVQACAARREKPPEPAP